MKDKMPLNDSALAGLLQADFLRSVQESPARHSLRTPECPSEPRLIDARQGDNWTPQERKHVFTDRCPFCLKVLDMLQRLDQDEEKNGGQAPPIVQAAYQTWLQGLEVPTFTPPETAEPAGIAPNGAGLTLIARKDPLALKYRLRPWLPGYLRRNGVEEGQADAFLDYILAHLSEMGDHFRDALPRWLAAFLGRAVNPETATVTPAFTAAEAVAIALREHDPEEPSWALDYRHHLCTLALRTPDDLLAAPLPDQLQTIKALPAFHRGLVGKALSLFHKGNEDFELGSAA